MESSFYSVVPNTDTTSLAQSIRMGHIVTHCPTCKELVTSIMFAGRLPRSMSAWPEFSEYGTQRCYCPNCHLFLDAWYRCNNFDYSDVEIDVTPWKQNEKTGRWETRQLLFGRPRSHSATDNINESAQEHEWLIREARFFRKICGPRFAQDEKRFSVSIPLTGRTRADTDKLLQKIKTKLRSKRAGSLRRVEVLDGTVWAHFGDKMQGSSQVWSLWQNGQLPADVCVWCYNNGRRYQDQLYDPKTGAAAVHPSLAAAKPRLSTAKKSSRLVKNATLEQAAAWLSSRLSAIEETNEEICDTLIRDNLIGVLQEYFIKGGRAPKFKMRFGLDDLNAEARLQRALKTFFTVARPLASRRKLTPAQREDLLFRSVEFFQDNL